MGEYELFQKKIIYKPLTDWSKRDEIVLVDEETEIMHIRLPMLP